MAETVGALEVAAQNVSTSSTKERVAIFEASVPSALNAPGVDVAELVPELVNLIFKTIPLYEDRTSQIAVEHAISRSLQEAAFLKAFTGTLVQTAEKSCKLSSNSVRYKLFRWSCLLIRQNPALLSAKNAFSRLVAVQASLLTLLLEGSYTVKRATNQVALHLFSEVADLFEHYVKEFQGPSLNSENSAGLINIMLQIWTRNSSLVEKHKAFFLELYVKMVLNSKGKPAKALNEAFGPLFKQLTHDDFGTVIVPNAVKMLRRNPELIMESVSLLLKSCSLDLSKYGGEFLPVVLPQARHSDEVRRKEAFESVKNIAAQSSDLNTIDAMFKSIKSVLGGSEGKLAFPYQRVGMINAILALSFSTGGKATTALAGSVSAYLISYYKDDGNEEVRVAVLAALSAWITKAGEVLPPETLVFFSAGLKEKENLRRAHLRCLRLSFRNGEVPIKVQKLVEPLLQLVKTSVLKPAQRIDGIYSLLLLANLAAVDMKADEQLIKEKIWSSVLQRDSVLLAPSLVSKLSVEDCVALTELVETVVLQHPSRMTKNPEGSAELFQIIVYLLWHPSWEVRKAASAVVSRFHRASGLWSEALFNSFCAWLPSIDDRIAAQRASEATEAVADTNAQRVPGAEVLSKALLSVSSASLATSSEFAAQILLTSHNPCIVRGSRKDIAWKSLLRKFAKTKTNIIKTLASDPAVVCKVLMGPSGLMSRRQSFSEAALFAFATAMQKFPEEFFPQFLLETERVGDKSSHDALTEKDIKIFRTPEGVLSTEQGVYVAETVVDKNIRRDRGRFKMYGDLGDEEETSVKEPLKPIITARQVSGKKDAPAGRKDSVKAVKKPGEVDKAKNAKDEARELQLKEEAAVRMNVGIIQENISLVLSALGAAAAANPSYSHEQLPLLVERVLPLLKSPIVDSDAYDTMEKLTSCVAPPLRPLGSDLAAALRLISTLAPSVLKDLDGPAPTDSRKNKPGVVERVVGGLAVACKLGPLPPPSFALVFPIVEQTLYFPQKTRLHDDLLQVLSLHCSPNMPLPRLRMIALLYHVLGCVPAYQSRISSMLEELCEGLEANDIPEALSGVYSEHGHVRSLCLSALNSIPALAKQTAPPNAKTATALWMAMHDPDKEIAELAEEVWDLYGHDLGTNYAQGLTKALGHVNFNVRQAAAEGLADAMDEYPNTVQETLSSLFSLYIRDLPIGHGDVDPTWYGRQGVALALLAAADVLTVRDLPVVATFLISRALADVNQDVRYRMVDAGVAIVDKQGKDNVALLLPIFENYLEKKSADEERYDLVREGVVIFLGALAKHLSVDDSKVTAILERLLEVLNTPSESVQRAVSNCLPPLMASQQENAQILVSKLLDRLLKSDKYGERRGAAFGLAGVVKGLGLSALKRYGIMDTLKAGVEDKASAKTREGALYGFECLCEKLGRLFEPYVIQILPLLLICFSDPVVAVREAADAAARAIMAQLSGQGVKLVLPALLKGLEDKAWRTKQGSVQLLGAMAFCAPRQLSQCLPTIVPKLSEVLTDTHPKVQSAAQTSLQQIGSVIRNPEIAALVPTLLVGIADPNDHTKPCLDLLLQTTFVNSVDAPSLALLVPIVHRGLRERSAETKKKAAQIVGNMSSLVTEHKDMLPYLGLLLPEVKKVLVDPIPEVRTVAARALGSLIRGMGEDNFTDLVPWLLETLKSETSSVERSGAAQGLSEVLAAIGTDYFESLLPDVIQNCSHQRAAVRDGHLTLFKYLPTALGPTFQQYLQRVLPAILDGLADENESVRDAALSAGHVLVEHYATTSLPLLLPAVEEGIFNDNWRIRQSSVELLGDLLFKVAGTSGKVVLEGGSDDEGASTEAHGRAIVDILGKERRNEVLAAVYMVRSDVSLTVRQAALHVWKTVVANTPKTLKEIMPVLMSTLISSLASTSSERRQVAGRSLGELVRKLGERVLPSIIPILSRGLEDSNGSTRQGVCMGLSEVMASAGKHQLLAYMGELIPTIRTALCDSEPEVREAAGMAFSTLFKSAGLQAVDEIVPALLHALEDDSTSATALDGLKQILSVRTAAVLPHILPKLVQPPLTAFNAHALAALAEVAGSGLNTHLSTVLPPLVMAIGDADEDLASMTKRAAETVVMAVDIEGLDALIAELERGLGDPQAAVRRSSAYLTGFLFKNTKLDLEEEIPNLLTMLIVMLTDNDDLTIKAAWEALGNITGTIPKENLPLYIKVVRDAVSTARDKERRKRKGGAITIPGFCLPKALSPVLQIFTQGLTSGSAELREQAAEGLGELIDVTNEGALKPFVVPITGPLIRIIGDRYPWQVKSAILATLGIIISKGGLALKPFLPQLQTTFMKCLQDNTRAVRARAASALGKLIRMSARVDPLVGDLLSGIQSAEGGVREAMLEALKGVMKNAGKSISPPVLERAATSLQDLLQSEEDEVRGSAARTLGILSQYLEDSEFGNLFKSMSSTAPSAPWTLRHGTTLVLASILRHAVSRVCDSPSWLSGVVTALQSRAKDDKVPVRESVSKALGRLLVYQASDRQSRPLSTAELLPVLVTLLHDDSSDVRRRALSSLKSIAKSNADMLNPFWSTLGPAVRDCLKDSSTPVRLAAERCAYHLFQLSRGAENVQTSQKYITGLDARRIAKQPEASDDSEDSEADAPTG
ncbi:unnamed protein product [Calypogeia fissa]